MNSPASTDLDHRVTRVLAGKVVRKLFTGAYTNKATVGHSGPLSSITLGVVHKDIATPKPTKVADKVWRTSHVAALQLPEQMLEIHRFLGRKMLPEKKEWDLLAAGTLFHKHFKNDYDYLLWMPDVAMPNSTYGVHFGCANRVSGISTPSKAGVPEADHYDHCKKKYGSTGQMQGFIGLNFGDNGPTLHEVLHQHANRLPPALGLGTSHWLTFSDVGGVLGGMKPGSFKPLGGGEYAGQTVRVIGDSATYSKLELYLMGLIPAKDVPTITVLKKPQEK